MMFHCCQVRSMDLNDELGQITHVFSDKTGTLTSNVMEFRKLSVGLFAYGLGTTNIGLARRRRLGLNTKVCAVTTVHGCCTQLLLRIAAGFVGIGGTNGGCTEPPCCTTCVVSGRLQ
jgi:hypothetical protein